MKMCFGFIGATYLGLYDTKQLSSGAYFIAAKLQGSLVQTKLDVVK